MSEDAEAPETAPVMELHRALHGRYGAQGWWPTTPPAGVHPRYYPDEPERRPTPREQWEIAVGAVLTQNTTWRNASRALTALARARRLSLRRLAACPREELTRLIHPALYYNEKARNLQELAAWVIDRHGGRVARWLAQPPAALRVELLARRGIGPETADCILLYAAGYPFFVIDAFTRRICQRLGWVGAKVSYDDLQRLFAAPLPEDPKLFSEFHALLVRHAVEHCRATPLCDGCCLRRHCPFGRRRDTLPTGERS